MNAAIDRQAAAKATESEGLTVEEARRLMADPDSFDEQERAATALQGSATASGAEGLGSDPVFDSVIAHPGWITHIKDFVAQERTVFTNGGGIVLRWPGQASGVHGGGEERHVGHKAGNHTWHDPLEYDDEGHYVSGYEDGGAGRFDGQLVSVLLALQVTRSFLRLRPRFPKEIDPQQESCGQERFPDGGWQHRARPRQ